MCWKVMRNVVVSFERKSTRKIDWLSTSECQLYAWLSTLCITHWLERSRQISWEWGCVQMNFELTRKWNYVGKGNETKQAGNASVHLKKGMEFCWIFSGEKEMLPNNLGMGLFADESWKWNSGNSRLHCYILTVVTLCRWDKWKSKFSGLQVSNNVKVNMIINTKQRQSVSCSIPGRNRSRRLSQDVAGTKCIARLLQMYCIQQHYL